METSKPGQVLGSGEATDRRPFARGREFRLRRRDPATLFDLLTKEFDLTPGLITHLHRLRWDIEKPCDEFKTRTERRTTWDSNPAVKSIYIQPPCLTRAPKRARLLNRTSAPVAGFSQHLATTAVLPRSRSIYW